MCKTRERDEKTGASWGAMPKHEELQQLVLAKQDSSSSMASSASSSSDHHQNQRLTLQDHLESSELIASGSSNSLGLSSSRTIRVTLLCRKADDSVLYMEAGKEFVDMLLSFMTLPIGTVMKLLRENTSSRPTGGISNIYESISGLDDSLMYVDKGPLLSPKPVEACDLSVDLLKMRYVSHEQTRHVYYKCCNHGCLRFVVDLPGQICPVCKFAMSHKLELIQPKASYPPSPPTPRRKDKIGYVKKNRTFIITDSLEILPLSTITSVILLSKLNLESLKDLDSVQVSVGVREVLELLKASLSSQTALNDVFRASLKRN